jgi:eukaryotic-like serine/threonine-protein kinase
MIRARSTPNYEDWRLLSPFLDRALELNEDERRAWISELEPEIATRLKAMLLEHDMLVSDRFLERTVVDLPSTTATLIGQTVGAFTIESQIGHGGMGTVWLARRNDGRFERQVAIKFLNVALLGRAGEERFRREGRILALLADPHIAELIDAGVTHTGQPYLVLEYVDGERIDRYCDQARLDIDSRIRLFLQVLDAVATAHANLIVHRDIKPSNVLVRKDGEVKLLDFGIAKLIECDGQTERPTALTTIGSALTPEFAAPEQLKEEPITASTDVYSLGVLLYVLLTGQHPYGNALHSPAELIKAIVDTPPVRPSDALCSQTDFLAENESQATLRSSSAEKLHRTLRGDLDTILLKTLKKDPKERYASVSLFAADLRGYLECEPIGARPDTLMYRTSKFVRRNRIAVALTVLAFLGIAAGAVGTLVQSRTARTQRDLALRQLARAERVSDLNELLLSDAAPLGKPIVVDQLLDREERVIAHEWNPNSLNHVELLLSLGSQYSSEDQNDKALRVLNNAYSISRKLSDATIRAKASCVLAGALVPVGEFARAEQLYSEGLHQLKNSADFSSERASCLMHGSEIAARSGNSQEAIVRAQAAEQAIQGTPLEWNLQGLNVLMNLATVLGDAGKFREADQRFQEASALMSRLGYDDSQKAAKLFNCWAATLAYDGRELEAEKIYRRALDISRNQEGEQVVTPSLLFNYASLLHQLGRQDEAARYLKLADSRARALHDNVLTENIDLLRARMYTDQHQFAKASALLDDVEVRLRRRYPPEHFAFAQVASARSAIALARGNAASATRFAFQAVALDEASLRRIGQCAAYLPTLLVQRSRVELSSGDAASAAADARRALGLLHNEAISGVPSSNVGRANLALAQALQATGDEGAAKPASRIAYANLLGTLGSDHPDTRLSHEIAEATPPVTSVAGCARAQMKQPRS